MGNDVLSGHSDILEFSPPKSYLNGHSGVLEGALSILEIEDLLFPSPTLFPFVHLYPGMRNYDS
jgi:hypothetical protein